ncbi:MAG: hypothetical protein MSH30_05790 [Campylobacter sp.]|nr:hypothetical protein [Campylobacter sp.]MCI7463363.1 hypothetical protein [Campylobacter sp.]
MLDIFRILDKVIHMEISQILNQTLSTYNTKKIINTKDVNPTNANSDEMKCIALNLQKKQQGWL